MIVFVCMTANPDRVPAAFFEMLTDFSTVPKDHKVVPNTIQAHRCKRGAPGQNLFQLDVIANLK